MTSVSLQNFGCRVNQAEAFEWAEEFQRAGLRLERDASRSDVVVVNTCTLTARADRDVRKYLARVGRDNPGARVIVTGCLVDRARAELEGLPNVTLVPNAGKPGLAAFVLDGAAKEPESTPVRFRARGLLKVQDGCDGRCTFCVIPSVRGASRSLPRSEALARLRRLAGQGFGEVVLTGIHLSSYGLDFEPPSSLLELLGDMEPLASSLRLRLSSLDPRRLDPALVRFLASSPLIRPHFHLSLQHGADGVLARMGRKSRAAEYREVLSELRGLAPEAGLGADIITGFPGESEADFEALRGFLEESPLSYIHVFSYSARPGTPAAAWPGVEPAIVRRRTSELRRLSAEKSAAFRRTLVGRTFEAVVIRPRGEMVELLTGNYIRVVAPGAGWREGDSVLVKLEKVDDRGVSGTIQG